MDGVIHIFDRQVFPTTQLPDDDETIYDVQVIVQSCDQTNETNFSAPLEVDMAHWGDIVGWKVGNNYSAPNGAQEIVDILAVLDKFENDLTGAIIKSRCDLEPENLDLLNNISDVSMSLRAFEGFQYPFPEPTECQ